MSKKVEEVILDHKDEIRRSLAEQREDNYMQIEHHFKEFHARYNYGKHFSSYNPVYYGGYGHPLYAYNHKEGTETLNSEQKYQEVDYQWKDGHLYRKSSPNNSPDRDRMISDKKVNSPKRTRSPQRALVNL